MTRKQAVSALKGAGVIIYPTSTLYGIGCNALNREAVSRVAEIKNNRDTGFICLISDVDMGRKLARFNRVGMALAKRFWPGALTLVLEALDDYPVTKNGTIALRVDPLALALVRDAGVPVVSTSANLPGKSPAGDPGDLDPALLELTDGVLASGSVLIGSPSTIVRCAEAPEILREGAISKGEVMDAWRQAQ